MQRGSVDNVVSGTSIDDELIEAGVDAVDRHLRSQPVDDNR